MKDVAVHVTLLIFLFACAASAQTTRPAPEPFSRLIVNLSQSLVNGNVASLSRIVSADTSIKSFDGDVSDAGERLFAATNGGNVVATRCYGQVPVNLASDLATDFANAAYVPQSFRDQMVPPSDQVVSANVTAGQWIVQTLNPSAGQLVGVIVVWPQSPAMSIDQRPELLQPVFVLLKAQMEGKAVVLKQIVFGNPLDHT